MTHFEKTFAETYTMRSRHFRLLGEAAKLLAEAYMEGDKENRESISESVHQAMLHSLSEHHNQ